MGRTAPRALSAALEQRPAHPQQSRPWPTTWCRRPSSRRTATSGASRASRSSAPGSIASRSTRRSTPSARNSAPNAGFPSSRPSPTTRTSPPCRKGEVDAGRQHRPGKRRTARDHLRRDGRIERRAPRRGPTAAGRRNEPRGNGTTPALQAGHGQFAASLRLRAPAPQIGQGQKNHGVRNLTVPTKKERKKKRRKAELFRIGAIVIVMGAIGMRQPLTA